MVIKDFYEYVLDFLVFWRCDRFESCYEDLDGGEGLFFCNYLLKLFWGCYIVRIFYFDEYYV